MKRRAFYVGSEVWSPKLGSNSKLVFTYLSRCANAAGESYPSLKTIAEGCGISRSTVKRALKELENCGAVTVEERYLRCMGGRRRTTNVYRVPVSFPQKEKAPETGAPEKENLPAKPEPISDLLTDREDALEELIDRLSIRSYEEEDVRDMLIMTMGEMWRKPFTVIGGERIPNAAVRARLKKLTGDAVRNALDALRRLDVVNPAAYFRSCLYNAPAETAAKASAFRQKLDEYGLSGIADF